MDLATYGAIISTFAFCLAVWSLMLHRSRWKLDVASRQPELTWNRHSETEIAPWERLTLTLRNRSNARVKAERIRVIWPLKARIVGAGAAKRPENKEFPWKATPLTPPDRAFRTMPLRLEAAHAGATIRAEFNRPVMGSGDIHSTELLVIGAENSRLILWISLSSSDNSLPMLPRSLRVKSRMIVV